MIKKITVALLVLGITVAQANQMKKYDVKSAEEESKEKTEVAEGMQAIVAGLAALTKAGIDMNKELTPEQEQIMQKAMMKAMGGEGKMLAKMKQEILKEGKMEEMQFAQKCFTDANTLKEANTCVDKGNKMFDDDEDRMHSWTAEDKKEILEDMKGFEKIIPCVKAAQTMKAFHKCMPRD